MSKANEKWSGYILRLDRETHEYKYGSWYDHYWNEVYEIKRGAEKDSRGERIRICWLDGDEIGFTFFDEETSADGIGGRISISEPKVCLRSKNEQGGRNEYAYSRSDHVVLKLERVSGTENGAARPESQTDDESWRVADELFKKDNKAGFEAWLKLCESGHARAASSVAYCYRWGYGTEKDVERAIEYYKLAIARGYPSYSFLGWLYNDLERNDEALEILLCGARANDAASYAALSILHPNATENGYVAAYLASRAFELDKMEGNSLGLCYLDRSYLPVVYPYAKYCFKARGLSREDIEACGFKLPDYWDEIEPIEPCYPSFALTLDTLQDAPNPSDLHSEGLELLYGDDPNEAEGLAKIKLAAECGYCPAIISAFSRELDGYFEMLELGAFDFGDAECIETLAVLLGEQVSYCEGDAKLNVVEKLWSLRKKLHPYTEIKDEIVKEMCESFTESYAAMSKAEKKPVFKSLFAEPFDMAALVSELETRPAPESCREIDELLSALPIWSSFINKTPTPEQRRATALLDEKRRDPTVEELLYLADIYCGKYHRIRKDGEVTAFKPEEAEKLYRRYCELTGSDEIEYILNNFERFSRLCGESVLKRQARDDREPYRDGGLSSSRDPDSTEWKGET